jgi:hypothetical protein
MIAPAGITGATGSFTYLSTSQGITGTTGSFSYLSASQQMIAPAGITGATGSFSYLSNSQGITGTTGSFSYLSSTNNTYLASESLSKVGIGTTNPNYTLDVNGVVGALSFQARSDYRIKKDIRTLDKEFTIDNLNPVIYKLIDNGQIQSGFIAHEVQEYYPFLVNGDKDGERIQSINYSGLIPILVKEIQDLKKEISNIKDKLLKYEK